MIRLLTCVGLGESGNFAVTIALLAPLLVLAAGGAVDMTYMLEKRTLLQNAADQAALAAAKELYLANTEPEILERAARAFATENLQADADGATIGVTIGGPASGDAPEAPDAARVLSEVRVSIRKDIAPDLPLPDIAGAIAPISVTAIARIQGGGRICVIGLSDAGPGTIDISGKSKVLASECAVYSNSVDPNGLSVAKDAQLESELACSAGGFRGNATNYSPQPLTDCPSVDDPLDARVVPVPSQCDFDHLKITDPYQVLYPGTYCGDLSLTNNAQISLRAGTFVFWNSKVKMDKGATLSGDGVTLAFIGDKAGLDLKNDSRLSLSASESGPMAGILIYADSGSGKKARDFKIESTNARRLVGTIYLPNEKLVIGGDKNGTGICDIDPVTGVAEGTSGCKTDIGEQSTWTALVADEIRITSGVNLVLNTDYSGSAVPVPAGIGPVGGNIRLAR